MATVAELKAELDELGVEYPSDAKKAELEQLVADAPPEPTTAMLAGDQPPEAEVPAPPTRAERRAAQPPLPEQLAERREKLRAQYVRDENGVLTFRTPPADLTEPRDTQEG